MSSVLPMRASVLGRSVHSFPHIATKSGWRRAQRRRNRRPRLSWCPLGTTPPLCPPACPRQTRQASSSTHSRLRRPPTVLTTPSNLSSHSVQSAPPPLPTRQGQGPHVPPQAHSYPLHSTQMQRARPSCGLVLTRPRPFLSQESLQRSPKFWVPSSLLPMFDAAP